MSMLHGKKIMSANELKYRTKQINDFCHLFLDDVQPKFYL